MSALPHFARLAEAAAEETRAFQRRSAAERLQAIFDLIAAGQLFLRDAPQRQEGLRQRAAQEAEWQRIQKELFARYGQ